MQPSDIKPIAIKFLKISGISCAIILLILAIIPFIFSSTINTKIKQWANNNIEGKLIFDDINLSFFKHFPSLTVTLYDVDLKGSAPFKDKTLLKANEIALGIDLSSLIKDQITINEFYLSSALINIQTDSLGKANYNVYKSSSETENTKQDSSNTSLGIELIKIKNSTLIYNDRSLPMKIIAKGFNYIGKGDFKQNVFDLYTQAKIDSLLFNYGGQDYIKHKKVNANLITKINTNSLTFVFEKNEISINKLPVTFKGKFSFLNNGYDMDFDLQSKDSPLEDIFTAFPPEYLAWLDETKLKGKGEIKVSLAGKYIAEKEMPDFNMHLNIQNGFISNKKAPAPIENIFLKMDVSLPQFDPQKMDLNIDSIYFNIEKDYFSGMLKMKGLDKAEIHTRIKSKLNLEKLDRALGIASIDLKGIFDIDLIADGNYATSIVQSGIRKKDTVITSIPVFNLKGKLQNGYFKMTDLPQAVENISFNIEARALDSLYQNTSINISDINMNVLANYLKGYIKLGNLSTFPIDAKLESKFNLADVPKFYPLDSLELKGDLLIDVVTKGTYEPKRRLFPVSNTHILLKNGYLKSLTYPVPLENININSSIKNGRGSFNDLQINILPVSFLFAGQPFELKANLQNFDNLKYDVTSNGNIDLGKIYKVFAISGYDVDGIIKTDLSLKGLQSDATSGRYNLLKNKGTLALEHIRLNSDLFPKPFFIESGKFSFNQDKMLFNSFKGVYGESKISLNGFLNNIIAYLTQNNAPLKGKFKLESESLNANELMAYADEETSTTNEAEETGVILIPEDLDVDVTAKIKKIDYDGMQINNFNGQILAKNSQLHVKEAAFDFAGTKVNMTADYAPIDPKSANFSYHIKAEDFDIQKAYKEIRLFREMASAAEKAHGIISLDYQLKGKLDASMYPIMPSLTGNGVLTLQKIKFKGFKLMNNIAKGTSHSSLTDPDVSKVEIKSSIKNNIMTIERTRMRMAGFRPRFEGQVSLDGQMNISFRLGLPPLGIFGIPIQITGTQETPRIKIGQQSKSDDLEEITDQN
jgi:AsmA protein